MPTVGLPLRPIIRLKMRKPLIEKESTHTTPGLSLKCRTNT
jgi:hypothetical protein